MGLTHFHTVCVSVYQYLLMSAVGVRQKCFEYNVHVASHQAAPIAEELELSLEISLQPAFPAKMVALH